ncbi:MAG: hypothetical protein ACRDRI_16415 [Pseudonocardiaceae bacterium]
MPGVILAGISGAGKTSTYQRLLAVLAQRQQETFEHRLATLNIALVLLSVPDERVLEQCVHSTRATRGEGWARHLSALGEDDEARAEYFRAAQRRLCHWALHSPLPTLNIDTSERQWDDYARAAADYVTALTRSA